MVFSGNNIEQRAYLQGGLIVRFLGGYERRLEHMRDFQEMKLDSHMLKHYVEIQKEKMEDIEFGMRIVKEAANS